MKTFEHQPNPGRVAEHWRLVKPGEFEKHPGGLLPQMIGTLGGKTFLITEESKDGKRVCLIEGKSGSFAVLDDCLPSNTASAVEDIECFASSVFNWEGVSWIVDGPGLFLNFTAWGVGGLEKFRVTTVVLTVEDGFRVGFEVDDHAFGEFEVKVEKIFRLDQIIGARRRMLALLEVSAFRIGLAARYNGTALSVTDLKLQLEKDGVTEKDVDASARFRNQLSKQQPERN